MVLYMQRGFSTRIIPVRSSQNIYATNIPRKRNARVMCPASAVYMHMYISFNSGDFRVGVLAPRKTRKCGGTRVIKCYRATGLSVSTADADNS